MNSYKTLFKNVSIITIGQFGSKLLVFLLVPIYTNFLSTADYGTYDLITAIISLMIPILTLNMYSSTQRFAMDEDANLDQILTYSLRSVFWGFIIFGLILLINSLINVNQVLKDYWAPAVLLFVFEALINVFTSFAVGLNKVTIVVVSGITATFSMLFFNILFLVILKIGLEGFFLANILGYIFQTIVLVLALKIWRYKINASNKALCKSMLAFCVPLIVNNIAWWVNNVSDRFVVTYYLGIQENGIYSIGYKIPSILNVFQTVFSQAWAISAVKSFDSNDEDGFFAKTYQVYNFLMVFVCSGLIATTKIVAKIMYANEFYEAWKFVPFLLISVLFGALAGYFGGIFSAIKKSRIYASSTLIGAVCNLVLNIILIQFIGSLGAAIATAVSYMMIWVIRLVSSKKVMNLKINFKKDIITYSLLYIQAIALLIIENSIQMYVVQIFVLSVVLLMHITQIKMVFRKLRTFVHR